MGPPLPQGRGSAGAIGWDREGCAPRRMYFWAGGMERPTVCMLGGPLLKKRVALRASPCLVAKRLAARWFVGV